MTGIDIAKASRKKQFKSFRFDRRTWRNGETGSTHGTQNPKPDNVV